MSASTTRFPSSTSRIRRASLTSFCADSRYVSHDVPRRRVVEMRHPATGIVLAGGSSRRMGQDKARLELGGRSLLHRVVEPVSRLCEDVIIAGADNPAQHLPGLSPIWVCLL